MAFAQDTTRTVQTGDEGSRLTALAAAAAAGDERAFAGLYDLLCQRIFNLVLRSVRDRPTTEDLCQEIWLRAHREIGNLRSPEALRAWLYRIASRACVDFARSSRGRHRGEDEAIDEFIAAAGPQPEDAAILGSEVRFVWETLGVMAPRQSIALYLKQVEGLSYAEIGSVLGCPTQAVEALLFRARQNFAKAYERVESGAAERCEVFSQVMASIIDREPTRLQQTALDAHAEDCRSCRALLAEAQRANSAYRVLPLLPAGKGALEAILAGGGTTAGGAGLLSAAAGLFGTGAFQAKVVLLGALLVAGGALAAVRIDAPEGSTPAAETRELLLQAAEQPPAGNAPPGSGSAADSTASDVFRAVPEPDQVSSPDVPAAAATEDMAPAGLEPASDRARSSTAGALAEVEGLFASASGAPHPSPDLAPSGPQQDDQSPAGQGSGSAQAGPSGGQNGNGEEQAATTEGPLASLLENTAGDLGGLAGETLDTVTQVLEPVVAALQPVDSAVEDLTGISVGEAVQDVTGVLSDSQSTAAPLNQAVEGLLEPVSELVEDPVPPVHEIVEDPLGPVEELTGPLLGPVLSPDTTPEAPPKPTSAPESTPPAGESPCLLLLC
jgi:RNA polymerase sigma-70 factor (ECF subfamily)